MHGVQAHAGTSCHIPCHDNAKQPAPALQPHRSAPSQLTPQCSGGAQRRAKGRSLRAALAVALGIRVGRIHAGGGMVVAGVGRGILPAHKLCKGLEGLGQHGLGGQAGEVGLGGASRRLLRLLARRLQRRLRLPPSRVGGCELLLHRVPLLLQRHALLLQSQAQLLLVVSRLLGLAQLGAQLSGLGALQWER